MDRKRRLGVPPYSADAAVYTEPWGRCAILGFKGGQHGATVDALRRLAMRRIRLMEIPERGEPVSVEAREAGLVVVVTDR